MNHPSLIALPIMVLLCVVFLNSLGCQCGDPVNDDTSEPADGETGEAQCVDEDARIRGLEAELAECKSTAPK